MSIEWNALRSWDGSQQTAFEELCCQLARHEIVPIGSRFIRKGTPDAGVECYWKLSNGDEWGWQAKFFTTTPESTQWNQIDDSVKTVLRKHPNLKKYIICIPLDRADPRIDKEKWFMDKWNDRVEKWTKWAMDKSMNVEFVYWGTSEIFDRLCMEEHRGRYLFWFNKDMFSMKWFEHRLLETLSNVGPRYTPELNIELPLSKIFDSLGCTGNFINDIKKLCGDSIIKFRKLSDSKVRTVYEKQYLDVQKKFSIIYNIKDTIDDVCSNDINWMDVLEQFDDLVRCIDNIYDELYKLEQESKKRKTEKIIVKNHNTEFHYLRQLRNCIYEFKDYIDYYKVNLTNIRSLLLLGDAGSGKTHLFCDIAKRRISQGKPTLLLLGSYFNEEEPWSQVLMHLGIDYNKDEFLDMLNTLGEAKQSRVLIMIDALNEGEGRKMWEKYIASIIENIKHYKWLCLAVSVRSTYETAVIPEHINEEDMIRVIHNGFTDIEYEAANAFFDFYGIHRPSIPLLAPEFQNPLFLKLFCQSLVNNGLTTIPKGLQGLNNIFNFYIESVNKKLSKQENLNFHPRLKIVNKAIDRIAEEFIKNQTYYLSLEDAITILDSVYHVEDYEKSLYKHLVSEGVLSEDRIRLKNGEWQYIVRFSYERFLDFIMAKHLINRYFDSETKELDIESLREIFLKDEHTCWIYKGIIESLFIQLPEVICRELFDLFPECKSYVPVKEAFLDSFIWRVPSSITNKTVEYINEEIMPWENKRNKFFDILLMIYSNEDHPFNAESLHSFLWKLELAERDQLWSIYLHNQYGYRGAVDRLIDWGLSNADKSYISDKAIELTSIVFAWFLTSSNRYLRDKTTKALINILTDRISIVTKLLNRFINVNDPYVIERLFAVAYGCIMRSHDREDIKILSSTVYELMFKDKEEVYPNILLRDYARGIIEFSLSLGYEDNFDIEKIKPPYKSQLSFDIPSKEELSKYADTDNYKSDKEWAMYSLYDSVMGYGDFARYVIGTNRNYSNWSTKKICEPDEKSLDDIYNDFILSLNTHQKSAWDVLENARSNLSDYDILRFLLKEQEISENELHILKEKAYRVEMEFVEALDTDKLYTYNKYIYPYIKNGKREKIERFDLELIQRWIFNRVLELGWSVERFGDFDIYLNSHYRDSSKPERIGKKYQWIALYEILARLSDNYEYFDEWDEEKHKYEGPWQLTYIRNIDPSCTLRKTCKINNKTCWWMPLKYESWNEKDDEWLRKTDDLPDVKKAIEVMHPEEQTNWLVLENYFKWQEDIPIGEDEYKHPTKQLWYILNSYIVKKKDIDKLYSWAIKQNFMGRWMPESRELMDVFLGEFYWSPAYKYSIGEDDENWVKGRNGEIPCEVLIPTIGYLQEEGVYDCSINESINLTLPSKMLVRKMGLMWNGQKCGFEDKNGKLIAFDPSTAEQGPSALLVNKEEFVKFLDDNGYTILWTVLGEKGIISSFSNRNFCRLEISGAYKLKNNIKGEENIIFRDYKKR